MGHSYTHRFVTSAFPKTVYENDPEMFHGAMEELAKSLKALLIDGICDPATKEVFRIAIIAVKGDAPYLAKMGRFYRSFNTLVKRGDERRAPKGVCHRCLAGTHGFPAEEINTVKPAWLMTQGIRVPWMKVPAVIEYLPHNALDPATFFTSDIWHVVHLGFGRSWIASVITLALEVIPSGNLEGKWAWLTQDYFTFCKHGGRQRYINAITPTLMSYLDKTGCMGSWSKGMLTTNLFLWLEDVLARLPVDAAGRLPKCRMATEWLNQLFERLYTADVFLDDQQCAYVASRGLRFLQAYSLMAGDMFGEGRPWLFPLYGKLHTFHELMIQIVQDRRATGHSFNPLCFGCQLDEDTVGRTSRISRRVSIRLTMTRTLQRYLVAAHSAFTNAKLIS
eukprot:Skav233034  [mRNA]  locus=scaffold909:966569:967744:- [translate_table: standard]